MTKKVRIKAWQETGDSAITWPTTWAARATWAARSSKKSILLAQVFFMPWRVTGIIKNGEDMPQDIILSIVFEIFR
jgi:hypothetical protein